MQVRREKLKTYYDDNVDPFGGKFELTAEASQLHDDYEQYSKEELAEKEIPVTIACRVMTKSGKGKVGFTHVQDASGQIQLYVRKDAIGEEAYELVKSVNIGDSEGVSGVVFKTKDGEVSIQGTDLTILAK